MALLLAAAVVAVAVWGVGVYGRHNADECSRLLKAEEYVAVFAYCESAAAVGDAAAQNSLGVMYEGGDGVAQDHGEAMYWYRLAAEQGNYVAQNNLYRLTRRGP